MASYDDLYLIGDISEVIGDARGRMFSEAFNKVAGFDAVGPMVKRRRPSKKRASGMAAGAAAFSAAAAVVARRHIRSNRSEIDSPEWKRPSFSESPKRVPITRPGLPAKRVPVRPSPPSRRFRPAPFGPGEQN